MDKDRMDLIKSLTDDEKKNLNADSFTISEIREIIEETALTTLERDIAIKRYIECKTFEEIATEFNYDERTIKRHLPNISHKLKRTCAKLFLRSDLYDNKTDE